MSFIVRATTALACLTTVANAQITRATVKPPPTPNRIIVVAVPGAKDGWVQLTELALDAKCIWQSYVAPEVAIFDREDTGSLARFELAPLVPWIVSTELDDYAVLQAPPCPNPGTTNDSLYEELWYLRNIGQIFGKVPGGGQFKGLPGSDARVSCAWNTTTGSNQVVIAVIDNGIDGNHPDLYPTQFWINHAEENGVPGIDDDKNGFIDDRTGWDFFDWDNDPLFLGCPEPQLCPDPSTPAFTHGTPVAGIIAAKFKNARGVAGVASDCRLMSLKITGDDWNSGWPGLIHVLIAMDYASRNGARVANCSFGWAGKSPAIEAMCIGMGRHGTLVVAAAGNDGVDIGIPENYLSPAIYSCCLDNVVSVAGSFASDELCVSGVCTYSTNYSPVFVSIAAPGYQLWSTDRVLASFPTEYTLFGGTSGATPLVSGIAGLVFSTHPTWTPGQVKARLLNSARKIPGLERFVKSGGIVDAATAVQISNVP